MHTPEQEQISLADKLHACDSHVKTLEKKLKDTEFEYSRICARKDAVHFSWKNAEPNLEPCMKSYTDRMHTKERKDEESNKYHFKYYFFGKYRCERIFVF